MLYFSSDYMEGAHEAIIRSLVNTNFDKTPGYGTDKYTLAAKEKIKKACGAPNAEVYMLVGGTQTNEVVIGAVLKPYEGVLAASTGHVSVHEAGAIEFGGHKVITLPQNNGKISAEAVEKECVCYENDENRDHMVMPGMVYISQPTEYGTLYTKSELSEISAVCKKHGLKLYADGARLAYALAAKGNDVDIKTLAEYCDVFYIGGTKCGALFGEAVVIPDGKLIPHFFTIIKQRGALLAKGRLLGIQFNELFTDNLYFNIGKTAVTYADEIRAALVKRGLKLYCPNPTNQVFFVVNKEQYDFLAGKVEFGFWEKLPDGTFVIRFATSWATAREDVDSLLKVISEIKV